MQKITTPLTDEEVNELCNSCCSWIFSWIFFSIGTAIALSTGDHLSLTTKCILCFPFAYMSLSFLISETVYAHRRSLKLIGRYVGRRMEAEATGKREMNDMRPRQHRINCQCSACNPSWQLDWRMGQVHMRTGQHAVPMAISSDVAVVDSEVGATEKVY
jgi:hypothetical protein